MAAAAAVVDMTLVAVLVVLVAQVAVEQAALDRMALQARPTPEAVAAVAKFVFIRQLLLQAKLTILL